ncbi:MAG TPA: hypothetical protein VF591_12580 [Pyrinomonadaceae bacterium]|jgi:hypothetical protein
MEVTIQLTQRWETHAGFDRHKAEETYWTTYEDVDPRTSSSLKEKIKKAAKKEHAIFSEKADSYRRTGVHSVDGGHTLVSWETLNIIFGTTGAAFGFLRFVKPIILEWIKNSSNRSVTIKKGDLEIRISGTNDIDKALKAIQELKGETNANKAKVESLPKSRKKAQKKTQIKSEKTDA